MIPRPACWRCFVIGLLALPPLAAYFVWTRYRNEQSVLDALLNMPREVRRLRDLEKLYDHDSSA